MYTPANAQSLIAQNAKFDPWIANAAEKIRAAAQPWRDMSYDQLWSLLFSHTIPRSWSVWSNGHCPLCRKLVPMYNWVIDPFKHPWKLACPHCRELFPKNDYHAYYQSGLDAQRIFRFELANAALLFNSEHPDPADELHKFCVDDASGVPTPPGHNDHRWRFIGTYLIHGQWKTLTLGGIVKLADAYAVTGDMDDARRCAILLHRVADLYRFFDHKTQSLVEEKYHTDGFISTWHDACLETRHMALAYDIIKDAIGGDSTLVGFLAEKAKRHVPGSRVESTADIRENIEQGIFRTAIKERHKIYVNFPGRDVTIMFMHNIMGTPEDRRLAAGMLDAMITQSTKVDGVTGEKGLNGYTSYVLVYLAQFLAYSERAEPGTIAKLFARYPRLRETFRFHIDTWCLRQQYYPSCGDAGHFAAKDTQYSPMHLEHARKAGSLEPSPFQLLATLAEITGDEAYVQVLYHANERKLDGLPYDLFCADPTPIRAEVGRVIERHGEALRLGNTLKDEWHLAILRSGQNEHERAAWMEYDSGGIHAHANCMNIGLFAKGLDLMPDMGYPTLQFDGFGTHYTQWYIQTASHNTVVIDGKNQERLWSYVIGEPATLWADGRSFAAVRATGVDAAFPIPGEPTVSAVVDVPSITLPAIGLYFHTPARAEIVRVYTKPIGAPEGESGWTLAFEDRFDRAELGPDWEVIEGSWRIENGGLVGHGHLGCIRSFIGNQRVDFVAQTDAETPCDLSAALASVVGGATFRTGAFIGFGSDNNAGSKVTVFGRVVARSGATIQRGKKHAVRCEVDGESFRLVVDGVEAMRYENSQRAVSAKKAESRRGKQFERTWARIDLSETDSYYLDIFRVVGGQDHAKFQHSHFGTLSTQGLSLAPAPGFYDYQLMRGLMTDPQPAPGWSAQWHVQDDYGYLPAGSIQQVFMRYIDLTTHAEASTCEAWCVRGSYDSVDETWVPRLMVRRRGEASGVGGALAAPLASTFVSLVEPHEGASQIKSVRRLAVSASDGAVMDEANVCLEVTLCDGRRDVLIAMDVENPRGLAPGFASGATFVQRELGVELSGELAWIRLTPGGKVERMALARGSFLRCAGAELRMEPGKSFVER